MPVYFANPKMQKDFNQFKQFMDNIVSAYNISGRKFALTQLMADKLLKRESFYKRTFNKEDQNFWLAMAEYFSEHPDYKNKYDVTISQENNNEYTLLISQNKE